MLALAGHAPWDLLPAGTGTPHIAGVVLEGPTVPSSCTTDHPVHLLHLGAITPHIFSSRGLTAPLPCLTDQSASLLPSEAVTSRESSSGNSLPRVGVPSGCQWWYHALTAPLS